MIAFNCTASTFTASTRSASAANASTGDASTGDAAANNALADNASAGLSFPRGDSQIVLIDADVDVDIDAAASHAAPDSVGFELGRDYARHRIAPPAPHVQAASALRDGLRAGAAIFGARTLAATPQVRRWLQLRLHAWLQGRSVELFQVTPNYLQQIDVSHCPITRMPLRDEFGAGEFGANESSAHESGAGDSGGKGRETRFEPGWERGARATSETGSEASQGQGVSVDRVRDDAGYAAGNLAVMSVQARRAKAAARAKAHHMDAASGFRGALRRAQQIEDDALPEIDGLTAAQWRRVGVLCSFVEPLSHAEASALPLLVLPPNRLRLLNPIQALQAFISQQLLQPGWSQRVSRFEGLLADPALKRDFKSFFMALLPRVLEGRRLADAPATRWAVEDAWRVPSVQQRWVRFAEQLDPARCEALLCRAAARRLTTRTVVPFSQARATEGWNLGNRGYVVRQAGLGSTSGTMHQARLC